MNFAELPPTMVLGATSLVTTAPAATTAFLPTVTPGRMVAPAPIVHNHHVLPDVNTVETNASETEHHPAAFIEVVAEELTHEGVVLVGVGHRVVQFEKDLRLAHAFRVFFGCGQPGVNSLFLHRLRF